MHLTISQKQTILDGAAINGVAVTAKQCGVTIGTVYRLCAQNGVKPQRGQKGRPARHAAGPLHDAIKNTDKTDTELAREFGISHQRVQQIRKKMGVPGARNPESRIYQKNRAKRAENHAIFSAKRLERESRAEAARAARALRVSEMWTSGATVSDISAAIGIGEGAVQVYIVHQRKKNPAMFPYRRAYLAKGA